MFDRGQIFQHKLTKDTDMPNTIADFPADRFAIHAACDMIKRLTMQYNRARQTQITMELLDIVGGANALE